MKELEEQKPFLKKASLPQVRHGIWETCDGALVRCDQKTNTARHPKYTSSNKEDGVK